MATTPNGTITQASAADAEAVTSILAEAFMQDPVSGWIFPDEAERRRYHRDFFAPFVKLALEGGHIDVFGDNMGAALWLPVDGAEHAEGEDDAVLTALAETIPGDPLKRFEALGEKMDAAHPQDPHAYLPFIGVDPRYHGQGVGGALIRYQLAELDKSGRAAYLEASCLRNAALYERLGFRPINEPITPADGPSLYPMWRDPA
ncbi:GNAT family N-acetyltransferase [Micromonospora sp. NPDC000089]|uniref:GNAT family N-acetyltransferase n=1 Tax=unclassified Micromonospora TaxID=2617518 RepID=UPI003698CD50